MQNQSAAHKTWNVLKGRDIGMYEFEQVDTISFQVLRNGEDSGWMVRYDETEEGFVCYDDERQWLNDRAFDTIEEIELALETWDYRLAHLDKHSYRGERPWAGDPINVR